MYKHKKAMKKEQLALLRETAAHYNSLNRCGIDGPCKYSPKTLHLTTSEGCAIGRKISPELALELDQKGGGAASVYPLLPPELQMLGVEFLKDIQYLHDYSSNWCKTGLSATGKMKVAYLITKYGLE